ncbi:MAG TPA: hypothetical protein DC057_14970 [Spirochaetia bacterium]|nr:hypothetical protein [Spirochaetia bacterium]
MPRNYILTHIEKRITGYIPIRRASIKIGQIITFYYPKSENNKHPTLIVLNPRFNNLLHSIVLDYMTLEDVNTFRKFVIQEVKEVETDEPDKFVPALRKLSTESQTPESFYRIRMRHYLDTHKNIHYRTYKYEDIHSLRLVAYNFFVK